MANYSLISEKNPILSTECTPWDWEKDGEIAELGRDMLKVMFEHNGIGLAALQIGINKRVFVMGNPTQSFICVNPEIVSGTGDIKDQEGCLSFPGLWLHVNRHETIQVRYQDILGKTHEREFTGLAARVFQHEYDHLNGQCFVNKVSKLSLELASKRRKKFLKRK
jgi:peptide deformylase